MSKAIEELAQQEEWKAMGRLADFQQYFLRKYSGLLEDERDKDDFSRHLTYLVHLIYREAQMPLTKQLTDFVVSYQRPLILEKP